MTRPAPTVTVPVEPMPEMIAAWYRVKNGHHFHGEPPPTDTSDYAAYRAMLAAAPAAPQAAGVGEGLSRAFACVDQVAKGAQLSEVYGGEWCLDPAIEFRAHLTAILSALRAPSREPEGGAVDAMRRDMAAIGHAIRMLTDEIGRIPEKGRDPVTINNLEYYASQVAEWSGRYSALATREEAPAEAGEDLRTQVVKLLDELIAHIVAIGPDKPDVNTPMSRRVWREVFADLIIALLAQPQARSGEGQ